MLRYSIVFLFLSSLVILFGGYIRLVTAYIDLFFTHIKVYVLPFLNDIGVNHFVSEVLLLVLIPVVIAGIPALLYRFIKGSSMPYFTELTWCIWLVIILSNILIQ